MPGTLFHLRFASMVLDNLRNENIVSDDIMFLCGNLIPDMAISKGKAHQEEMTKVGGVFSPNMNIVKEKFFKADDVYVGIFTHLFLDKFFIEEGLLKWLKFLPNSMQVYKLSNPKCIYTYDECFGKRGIYGDYTSMNHLILQEGIVTQSLIESIPEELPMTGFKEMDNRKSKTWKQELDEFLNEYVDNYGILEFDKMITLLNSAKEKLIFTIKEST